ncbi:MAG: hypothetical protein DRH44_06705, partial [Candidatus Coatesbacteria bacterium]
VNELDVQDYFGLNIKTKQYVGWTSFNPPIELKNGRQLEQIIINPKVEYSDFIKMLEIAYDIELPELVEPARLDSIKDLRIILAHIYIRMVDELIKKHLRRNYITRVENLESKIKGKLLLGRYIRENLSKGRPQVALCQFYELTPDNLLNQIVKAGLIRAKILISQSFEYTGFRNLSKDAVKLIGFLANVSDRKITPIDFAKIHYHTHNRHYKHSIELAKILLFKNCFAHYVGNIRVSGLFIDMNDLFEKFVAGLLYSRFGKYLEYQRTFNFSIDNKDGKGKLIPDITIDLEGENIVIDAKYKELFETEVSREEEINTESTYGDIEVKIRHSDIYQMVAYLDNIESDKGVIVYPFSGENISKSTIVKGFGNKRIKLIGIGLSNIEKLKEEKDKFAKECFHINKNSIS